MNVFDTHAQIISDYASYIESFINISDEKIKSKVELELKKGKLWPQPLLQFNPAYQSAGRIDLIADSGILNSKTTNIFRGYSLYRHQLEAIKLGVSGRDFVVTSGTGSGKSLTYMASIFHSLLENPGVQGVQAIIVYPMNALINSQTNEFTTYKENFEKATGEIFPITFGQYTGQEKQEKREEMRESPPQILLTNYMMLELLLTRIQERRIRSAIYENLGFLVFDELHTYRGRQGADIAMLIRRVNAQTKRKITFIGTSATMVSVGTVAEQREEVAKVATKIFGRKFDPDQIINETLTRSLDEGQTEIESEALSKAIDLEIDSRLGEQQLRSHPVAIWLENRIALEDRDGSLVRRTPLAISEVVLQLSYDSGQPDVEKCRACLANVLLWISTVNQQIQENGSRYTILPYKLHQFIAQTGSVYTTLDQGDDRFITLEPGIYKHDDQSRKPIYANVFSRETGHPFICVTRVGDRLEPREFRSASEDFSSAESGYLIVGEDIWDAASDIEYLPDAWVRKSGNGIIPDKKYAERFPRRIFFDGNGNCSDSEQMEYSGWFMSDPLLFDPSGGVFFDTRTNEGTKLTKLGSEGRSTSTTITAFTILNRLHDEGVDLRDQRLLSFTDNRQDAALQAGHFNDFVQVIQLRAAIYKALKEADGNQLNFATIGPAVFKALELPIKEYSIRPIAEQLAPVRKRVEELFQSFLVYRVLADLRRSWRIVLPNLEQCGLLAVEYQDLTEVAESDAFWSDVPLVSGFSHDDRLEFLSTILDFFRLEYALHSVNFLSSHKLKEAEKLFREGLKPPWTLDEKERLREPNFIRLDPLARSAKIFSKSMGPASSLGKYVKYRAKLVGLDPTAVKGEAYREFILLLMRKLAEADYLVEQSARSDKNETVPIYQLSINKLIWKIGDGRTVKSDAIKRRSYKDSQPRPNIFFRGLYERDFSKTKHLRAEDHTGQLGVDTRIEREERFRAEWFLNGDKRVPDTEKIRRDSISALFCSPTMELGVDIGGLSVVHLRNAPPNPSNYAQRSGRAGRSGQGALIFTYCSSYSPHDRHYFQNQAELVAGAVRPPQIDLINKELLETHLNALAISEIGLPGLDAEGAERPSLMRLVDENADGLPLRAGVLDGLKVGPTTSQALNATFRRAIVDLLDDLGTGTSAWFTDEWIDKNLDNLGNNVDQAMKRWRVLYKSARSLLTRATQPIESGRLHVGSDEYRKYKRQQDQANHQLNLLRNDLGGSSELSEFYPYRYLASEGFLPGYNFTRLPLRIFVPRSDSTGEFISRPRSVAIREFGPLNILYHNGRKYRVSQLVVQDAESSLTHAKVSKRSGYFLTGEERDVELCPFSGVHLSDSANTDFLNDILEMSESRAEEIERISCEEEERISRGYQIDTYFSIDGGDQTSVRKAIASSSEAHLLNLRFIPAARFSHINSKWRSQKADGFPIGLTSGDWRSTMPDQDDQVREQFRLVKLWTSNTSDALYIEPIQALGLEPSGVLTLGYALKRAIESEFQVESNEIGVIGMGDHEAPNIMLFESAEGSLGILSQFVENPDVFRSVIEAAISICNFDDPEYMAPASYDDLLSYYNQRDHKVIDRFLVRDALEKLKIAEIQIQTNRGFQDYEEHYRHMQRNLDPNSSTERVFLKHLYENGLRLPDAAQKHVDGIFCQPDFYYEPRTWVFCDGTPHDEFEVKEKDYEQRQLIIGRGDEVWTWHYREDLAAKIASRPDIFKKVK